jgi:hypothetical protein
MARLKPWYKVVTPREDLREGKPLDASEFAVHLDQIRDGRAPKDYQNPELFFEKTFLTKNLKELSGEVVRRLSGEKTETSAIFNMATQFGGGKTHALALLYHLVSQGRESEKWQGVSSIISQAGISEISKAKTAVFVGTEFDSIDGRGGDDGTPNRKTPWGEIAFQLSGVEGFKVVEEHEKQKTAPAGDVIRKFLPQNKPCLILIDELLNYISRSRKSGLATQLYNFLQNLCEEARARDSLVLVVSIPASELEMTAEDQSDYERFKKLLDRLGKPVIMSAESETSEIIRRRLFEWDPQKVSANGKVLLSGDAHAVCNEYAEWVSDHRQQLPNWFTDHAKEAFESSYPFHPMVLSVFERKWQELPRFQQTRGVLRLLALWISNEYQQGFKYAKKELLIGQGSAPLEDERFRAAVFEQLGESRLEGALTTDICGRKESHAIRLDAEAIETVRKANLHKKVATSIFLESNGGQLKQEASVPEIRMAVSSPDLDIGHIETVLDALMDACYYLNTERNQYKFSLKENLNKRFADRRANVKDQDIDVLIKDEIEKVFASAEGIQRVFFPEQSSQIPDRPIISLIIMSPDHSSHESEFIQTIDTMTKEYGKSARIYKSALIWVAPQSTGPIRESARKFIAWTDIGNEDLKLDDIQKKQLDLNIKNAKRDLKESIWRTYTNVMILGKDNEIRKIDLGIPTSSSADSMSKFILSTLKQTNDVEKDVSPRFLIRNWPPAFIEWCTKSVRDAFYASPQFPRLINADAIKRTISRGVGEGYLAYIGKSPDGSYSPFIYKEPLNIDDVEISDDMFIVTSEEAEKHIKPPELTKIIIEPQQTHLKPGSSQSYSIKGFDQFGRDYKIEDIEWTATGGDFGADSVFEAGNKEGNYTLTARVGEISATCNIDIRDETGPGPDFPKPDVPKTLTWSGEVAPQKWTNLYMKVLSKYVNSGSLKIDVNIEASPNEGVDNQQIEEIKAALRELGLNDNVNTK